MGVELIALLIASFLTFALYHLMDPFITVWLGEEYILPRSVLIVILTNFFISQFRGTNDQFISVTDCFTTHGRRLPHWR